MFRLRVVALVVGAGFLLSALVLVEKGTQDDTRDAQRRALATIATEQARILDEDFDRARTITLLLARTEAFSHVRGKLGAPARAQLAVAVNETLDYLRTLYPDGIGEACFIDSHGVELARSVRGVVSAPAQLSPDEKTDTFFPQTLRLASGQVFQSQPYLSRDARTWVISTSTPVAFTGVSANVIVHYEVELASFAPKVSVEGAHLAVADAGTGQVVLDATAPHRAPVVTLGGPWQHTLTHALGNAEQAGRAITYHRVLSAPSRSSTNANDWYVIASAPLADSRLMSGFGRRSLFLLLASLALLAYALTNYRGHQRALRVAAETDSLTGLPNRFLFQDVLATRLRRSSRSREPFALLLMDLVRFKDVNDTLGHLQGDRLLVEIGHRLQQALRDVDLVARLGGDEFAVLLSGDGAVATGVAERVLEALGEPIVLSGGPVAPSVSIGIAVYPGDATAPEELLRLADIAMYDAKRAQVPYRRYVEQSSIDGARRLALLNGLRSAVDSNHLTVAYQPLLDLATDRVVAVEALARWHHDTLGAVPPDEFIPMAEEHGLIDGLTTVILHQSLRSCAEWLAGGLDVSIAVNISARSLSGDGLVPAVSRLLMLHGVPAHRLRLELTETAVMADPQGALRTLTELHAMGVRLSIDDYGTGYSSLAYLHRLPVDEIKIDRTFISGLVTGVSDGHIVRSTIELAHSLGLTVVAEGIEDDATLEALRALGCDRGQGYYLARPMEGSAIPEHLRKALHVR